MARGSPAYVELSDNGLNIYSLSSAAGVQPVSAGLLTRIDNGYGASTTISYRSAKEDASTDHLLPSPEVVVTAVTTRDVLGVFDQSLSPTFYAYGDANQYFDSALDRWVFPGYRRKVTLQNTGDPGNPRTGNAVITDSLSLDPFDLHVDVDLTTRFLRYLKAGRTSDVTTISGELGLDPWALLTTDIRTDARRIAASHMEYSGRLLLPIGPTGDEYCFDMLDPYDFTGSRNYNPASGSLDQCVERGFALQTSVTSWRGTPGTAAGTADVITSDQIVKTGRVITAFDGFGRVTDSTDKGDLADDNNVSNDNLCVHVDYATPQTAPVRVLNAVAWQTVQDCKGVTLAKKSFEYDGLSPSIDEATGQPVVQVTNGFVSAGIVTGYDGDTHVSLGDIRLFDADNDPVTGNPTQIRKTRSGDNARQGTNLTYDPFALVLTRKDVWSTGTNFDTLFTIFDVDPVTLKVKSMTDTNGTAWGTSFDGFGRVVRSKVTPRGGSEGVLSSTSYSGFELVLDTDGDGVPDSP